MWFYLYDSSGTYDLDANVINLNIGGVNRNYDIKKFAGASGGYLTGEGNYSPNTITFSKKNKINSTSSTAWNDARNTLINWFTKPKSTDIYLRITDGESPNTKIIETKIIPMDKGAENIKSINIIDTVGFSFESEWGYFKNVVASTDTLAITG